MMHTDGEVSCSCGWRLTGVCMCFGVPAPSRAHGDWGGTFDLATSNWSGCQNIHVYCPVRCSGPSGVPLKRGLWASSVLLEQELRPGEMARVPSQVAGRLHWGSWMESHVSACGAKSHPLGWSRTAGAARDEYPPFLQFPPCCRVRQNLQLQESLIVGIIINFLTCLY